MWKDLFRPGKNEKTDMLDVLKDNILFATLTRRELKYLSSLLYERVYQQDEPVFKQNDRGIGMYLIAKGRIAINTHNPQGDVHVTTLAEGNFFGELALIDPENIRTATAIAMDRTALIGFFKPDLMEIIERKPDMGAKILFQLALVLGRRLLETTEKITFLTRTKGMVLPHDEIV